MSERNVAEFNPTERFSDRVADYVKYRPGYPREVLDFMREELNLNGASVVADVGSGTGILSRLFLENGNTIYGVEPNDAMRAAGEELLRGFPHFRSVAGTAEATTLDDRSVDFVAAGQAFHWFDVEAARREFARIIRPAGYAVLIWNSRRLDSTPFLRDYESLLHEFGTDYAAVSMKYAQPDSLGRFFPQGYDRAAFGNHQHFGHDELKGRLLSSSYAPLEGPRHAAMLRRLREVFDAHQQEGRVLLEYDTEVYYGII